MDNIKVKDIFKKYTMIIALILVILFFQIGTGGKILFAQNINNLISQNAYVFVLATGMLCCILTGGNIDLSVGSVVCFTGGIGAAMMAAGSNMIVAVVVMLVVGLLVGMFQGFWIAYIKVPPFIATLAGMYAFRGLSNVVLQGFAVSVTDTAFLNIFGGGADCYVPDFIGSGELNVTCLVVGIVVAAAYILLTVKGRISRKAKGYEVAPLIGEAIKTVLISGIVIWLFYKLANYKGISAALIWIAIILTIYSYITKKTTIGRYLYAVGGNEKATRLSGVNTKRVYFIAYANMGLLAGLAGILTIARAASAQPTYGQGYEMDAIAACFIGGASAYGGIGSIMGMVVGATLMGVINQGMSIMGINANYQSVVKGVVLLVAIIFDVMSKKEKN
jgi:putative multiple sugar transport system permease protein